MATPNPHTHGTISWANFHMRHAAEECAQVKDCPDCKLARQEQRAAEIAGARVSERLLEESMGPAPPAPPGGRI